MKTFLKFAFVFSLTALVAACGPHGNRNNNPNTAPQNNQSMSQSEGRHHGGGKLRRACAADIQKYCSGGEKIRRCLRQNSANLQIDCKTALDQAIERSRERRAARNGNSQRQQNGMQQNQATPQTNGQQHNNAANNDDDDDN